MKYAKLLTGVSLNAAALTTNLAVSNGPSGGTFDVNLHFPQNQLESHLPEILKMVTDLASALAWPLVVLIIILMARKSLPKLAQAFIDLVERSDRLKILDVIDIEAGKAAREAEAKTDIPHDISDQEKDAAMRLGKFADEIRLSDIQLRISELAVEYEATRARMTPGRERTRAMNAITARMHTLAILARPLLPRFAGSDRPGDRLAAICILEVSPDIEYVSWLANRMKTEKPFLMFHAALGLREAARRFKTIAGDGICEIIEKALGVLDEFERREGVKADVNTRNVLMATLVDLAAPARRPVDK